MNYLTQFANNETAEKADLFSSIGIDWKLLVLQTIAFLILLWFLKKFVYPSLVAMLDKREKMIEESVRAARDAEKNAAAAEEKTTALMKKARKEADELLASAKTEATSVVETAEKKARTRTEQMTADAQAEIARNIAAAKKELRSETLELVAEATEKVVGKTVTSAVDKKVVADAVKEVKTT